MPSDARKRPPSAVQLRFLGIISDRDDRPSPRPGAHPARGRRRGHLRRGGRRPARDAVRGQPAGQGAGAAHRPGPAAAHQAGAADRVRRGRGAVRAASWPGWSRTRAPSSGMSGAGEPTRLSIAVNADSLATWFLPALTRRTARTAALFRTAPRGRGPHGRAAARGAGDGGGDLVAGRRCRAAPCGRSAGCATSPWPTPDFAAAASRRGAAARGAAPTRPWWSSTGKDDLQDGFVAGWPAAAPTASARRHYVPTSEGFVDAVAAGLGWGMVPGGAGRSRCCRPAACWSTSPRTSGRTCRCTGSSGSSTPPPWRRWPTPSAAAAAAALRR